MEELIPQNRQEAMLRSIALAAGGEAAAEELVPQWDDEKFLDDILKAAQGESPVYNIEPRWHHQKFYKAIADALASSGGGCELLATKEFEVSTTSTSATNVGNVELPDNNYGQDDIIVVHIRDKAGKHTGYFYGTDSFFLSFQLASGSMNPLSISAREIIGVNSSGNYVGTNTTCGVYADALNYASDNHTVTIKSKYNANYGTIDGTYVVEVYKWTPPFTLFRGDPIE